MIFAVVPYNLWKSCHSERHSIQNISILLDAEFVEYNLFEFLVGLLEFLMSYILKTVLYFFGKLHIIL